MDRIALFALLCLIPFASAQADGAFGLEAAPVVVEGEMVELVERHLTASHDELKTRLTLVNHCTGERVATLSVTLPPVDMHPDSDHAELDYDLAAKVAEFTLEVEGASGTRTAPAGFRAVRGFGPDAGADVGEALARHGIPVTPDRDAVNEALVGLDDTAREALVAADLITRFDEPLWSIEAHVALEFELEPGTHAFTARRAAFPDRTYATELDPLESAFCITEDMRYFLVMISQHAGGWIPYSVLRLPLERMDALSGLEFVSQRAGGTSSCLDREAETLPATLEVMFFKAVSRH